LVWHTATLMSNGAELKQKWLLHNHSLTVDIPSYTGLVLCHTFTAEMSSCDLNIKLFNICRIVVT